MKDCGRQPEGGSGQRESNQIILQEPAYVPYSNPKTKTLQEGDEYTNQQRRNDPLEVANTAEKNEINWTPS
jgi:hypothetical protein